MITDRAWDDDPAPIDLDHPRRVLVVGVGGPGMSAVATVLAEMGHQVRGSDLRESEFLDRVRAAGVEVVLGHRAEHLDGIEVACVSTAIWPSNLEVVEARTRGIPVVHRSALLAAITRQARSVGVAGTHGKTTTTSLLTLMAQAGGLDPSYVIGGQVRDLGDNAMWTGSGLMVVEADESDGTYRALHLGGTVLTNVEIDHLDYFGTPEAVVDGFRAYLAMIEGPIVACADDPTAAALGRERGAITYGTAADATVRVLDVRPEGPTTSFTLQRNGVHLASAVVAQRGLHNVLNATAALTMATELGVPADVAAPVLARFGGVGRRFEVRAARDGITLVDDYAHLPAEIAATLAAARGGGDGWRRIVAVFQPNRYSRMEVLSPEYRDAFSAADVIVLTDVYPSGEPVRTDVTGKLVVDAVLAAHPFARVVYLPERGDLAPYLARELRAGDVCISMGCGDIATLPDEVLGQWGAQP